MARIGVGRAMIVGKSLAVRLPVAVVREDGFPFVEGDELVVKIEGSSLVVRKA